MHVPKGGNLSIKGLPFHVGETVEVTVRVVESSLRGKYKGRGLMKTFLAGKKQEKEL
jgi:acyl dehydratase